MDHSFNSEIPKLILEYSWITESQNLKLIGILESDFTENLFSEDLGKDWQKPEGFGT